MGWRYQSPSWWVEGVEHGNTVRLVEGFQAHLVDERLQRDESVCTEAGYGNTNPASEAEVHVSVKGLDLLFLLLHFLRPFRYPWVVLTQVLG